MKIFEGHGLSLHKRDGNYYIRYMAGEIASWLVEIKITPEEAGQVQLSAGQANEVVYKYQNLCFAETGSYWKRSDYLSPEEMRREGYMVPEGASPASNALSRPCDIVSENFPHTEKYSR